MRNTNSFTYLLTQLLTHLPHTQITQTHYFTDLVKRNMHVHHAIYITFSY